VKAVLIDVGGVLMGNHWPAAALAWGERLGLSEQAFMAALFGGNDDQVLIGRMTEAEWWDVVGQRLRIGAADRLELRQDLEAREVWDTALVALLRRLRGRVKTAIVSNAWPELRTRMASQGLLDVVDEIVLSCEAGCAKPDQRIFEIALERVANGPIDTLFVDDTPEHVAVARSLGMHAHLHTSTHETIATIEWFVTDVIPPNGLHRY
jgi:putative hydrolase of the HAD superfamily